jgi:hypothetical protein
MAKKILNGYSYSLLRIGCIIFFREFLFTALPRYIPTQGAMDENQFCHVAQSLVGTHQNG